MNGRRCRACCKAAQVGALMAGLAHSQQAQRPDGEPAADEATSAIDKMVAREIDSFTAINDKIVAQVMIKSNHSSTCQFNSHPPTRIFVCVP